MNELIKRFADQATTIEYGVDNGFDRVVFDKEKFAELIVRECITLGTNFTNRNYSDDVGERIAKHFGVEE
jgi:hypothetical protein